MGIFVKIVINAIALLITAQIVPGFHITSFSSAIIAAIVLGIVNGILRPIMIIITLPINIMTLGLFTLIINALMIFVAAYFVRDFRVEGLMAAIIGSLVLSFISMLLNKLID